MYYLYLLVFVCLLNPKFLLLNFIELMTTRLCIISQRFLSLFYSIFDYEFQY